MKNRIVAVGMVIVMVALTVSVIGVRKSDTDYLNVSNASLETRAIDITDELTPGGMFDIIGDISEVGGGIIGNIIGDLEIDDMVSKFPGSSVETYPPQNTTGGYIDIVPAATLTFADPSTTSVNNTVETSDTVGETVDFGAASNPYTKPVGELKGGDTGDGVRWIQWIFIYTRYGLKDNGITGVFDEDTMAVVKKLQKENGMVVDGVVDDEVIDKIEYLYFQSIYSEPATFATTVTTQPSTYQAVEQDDGKSPAVIVALIAVIWILAIIFVIIIVLSKRKAKNSDDKSSENNKAKNDETKNDDSIKEEANKNESEKD